MIIPASKAYSVRLRKILSKIQDMKFLDPHVLKEVQDAIGDLQSSGDLALDRSYHFADLLEVDFQNLSNGKIDLEALSEHLKGNKNYLPTRYQNYAQSKVRTINNVLDFLDAHQRRRMLRKLQINEQILTDPDRQVCGQMLMDLFYAIHKEGVAVEAFRGIGFRASQKYKPIFLKAGDIQAGSSAKLVYELAIHKLDQHVEKNMQYKIEKMDVNKLLLVVTTREDLQDALKIKIFGNQPHCFNIMGWYEGILTFSKDQPAIVKKVACVHQGDSGCRYEIEYSHVRKS